jgi:hypothetical protein
MEIRNLDVRDTAYRESLSRPLRTLIDETSVEIELLFTVLKILRASTEAHSCRDP